MIANRAIAITGVVLICGTFASGCGSNSKFNLVKGANVVTQTVNGEAFVKLDVIVDTKDIRLPAFSLPIKKDARNYGTLSLRANAGGGGIITVDVNLTQATSDKVVDGRLPNGSPIPIGVGTAEVLGFDVSGSGSKVYVALADGVAMVGTAIAIKEIDRLGQSVGGANLFPSFSAGDIRGVAGIFTGTTSGTSGLGVFADFGALLKKEKTSGVLMARMAALSTLDSTPAMLQKAAKTSRMNVASKKPSRSKEKKMNNWLYKLNKEHKRKRGKSRLTLSPEKQAVSYVSPWSRSRYSSSRYGYSSRYSRYGYSRYSRYGYWGRYRY